MEICFSAIAFLLVTSAMVVAVNYYNDRNARNKKAAVLDQLHNTKVIHLDVKSSARAVGFTGFQFLWQRAEVIIIENAAFYFGYFPMLFNSFRMYRGVAQLGLPSANVPDLLGDNYSFVIDSTKIDKNYLTLAYSRKNDVLPVKRAMTLVIDDAGKLEEIRQMLKVV